MGSTSTTKPAAGVDGQYGPAAATSSGSTYTPKPVASLLGLSGVGGSAQHYGPKPGSTTVVEEKIGVPNGVVGYIIGRGGESIISMQRRSNCKVQIQKEFEMEPGSTQRVITLTADSREAIDAARGIIEAMVKEKMVENGGGGVGGGGVGGGGSGGRVGGPGLGAGGMAGMDPQTQRLNQAIADGHHLIKLQVRTILHYAAVHLQLFMPLCRAFLLTRPFLPYNIPSLYSANRHHKGTQRRRWSDHRTRRIPN